MDDRKVFGSFRNEKLFFADPHDMERAKRWGELLCIDDNLAFYFWRDVTYVAPVNDPPMLRLVNGGRGP